VPDSPQVEREAAIKAEITRRAGQGADDEQYAAIEAEVRERFAQEAPVKPMAPIQVAIRRAKGGWLSTDGWREHWTPPNEPRDRRAMSEKHVVQADVEEFHRALEIPVHDTPAIRRPELRAELIREEAKETCDAIERGDLVEAIDGLCDVLCVVYGAALEFGIDLAPFWDEVHRTNMAKVGGPVRKDGKRLKPPGWTPPDIAGILDR
jgi:hypothetical protein